ncbi:MAG: tetratricopeptide repeat protein [Candidatus Omnitrophica bacterium]|nr:tetratricopeptide repeat protein [Candidatus Omnitrophota bacterium]
MRKTSLVVISLVSFIMASVIGPIPVWSQGFQLPSLGQRVSLSPVFIPPLLKGVKVYPDNPFKLDFILDQGGSPSFFKEGAGGSLKHSRLSPLELKQEASKLIKYFLASITVPEKDLWVNLSPYEKNRIIPHAFGLTEMGRDLLAQDYMLKQITASLIYPEGKTGQRFWKRVYAEAARRYGKTDVQINTFNKVWIMPDKAVVYENEKAGTAYVVEAKLKVMLEQDYLSLEKHAGIQSVTTTPTPTRGHVQNRTTKNVSPSTWPSKVAMNMKALPNIIREIVIPELTKEVNQGQNFAQLRQVYHSLILATWYKKQIKDSLLETVYANKNKVAGIGYAEGDRSRLYKGPVPSNDIEFIYNRYLKAFKKGVYNYIKEEQDAITQQPIERKYFSGGVCCAMVGEGAASVLSRVHSLPAAIEGGSHDLRVVQIMLDDFKSKPVWPSLLEKEFFAGPQGHESRKGQVPQKGTQKGTGPFFSRALSPSVSHETALDWLSLNHKMRIQFVPRSSVARDFLNNIHKESENIELPEDINVEETFQLIKKLRGFSEGPLPSAVDLQRKFMQAAIYLAQHRHHAEFGPKAYTLAIFYGALAEIFDNESTSFDSGELFEMADGLSDFTQEQLEVIEEETLNWLGVDTIDAKSLESLSKRAVPLAIQGLQIKTEALVYWQGLFEARNSLMRPGRPTMKLTLKFLKAAGAEIFNYFVLILKAKLGIKVNVKTLKDDIQKQSEIHGPESRQVADAQERSIETVLKSIIVMPGWSKGQYSTTLQASPNGMSLKGEANCVGRTILTTSYLEELGVEYYTVRVPRHVILLARLADGRYRWVEPSDVILDAPTDLEPLPSSFKIPDQGLVVNLGVEWAKDAFIDKGGNGLIAAFYHNLGKGFQEKGDFETAVHVFEKARSLSPQDPFTYLSLGIATQQKNQNLEKAIGFYKQALSIYPSYVQALYRLGVALFQQGNVEAAKGQFKKVIEIEPGNGNAYNMLGIILFKQDRLVDAINAWQNAVDRGNSNAAICRQNAIQAHDTIKSGKSWEGERFSYDLDSSSDEEVNAAQVSHVESVVRNGGIDMTPSTMNLQTKQEGKKIKFYMPPILLRHLQNAAGFVPVIISIHVLNNLRQFLEG